MSGLDLIERFEAGVAGCGDDRALMRLLEAAAHELGFDHVALLHHASVGRSAEHLIRIDTYPPGWEEELAAAGLIGADPVHQACLRTTIGFAWEELPALAAIGWAERQVLERARRFGLYDGFTIPANIPGEPTGSCTFAVGPGRALPRQMLLCTERIGALAFHAARRIHALPARPGRPRLSRRERQCVRLVTAGKTDWEIATILGLSAETVRQYVKRARAAYDVVSRVQLVACALRDGLATFEDSIPPDGGMG